MSDEQRAAVKKNLEEAAAAVDTPEEFDADQAKEVLKAGGEPARELVAKVSGAGMKLGQVSQLLNIDMSSDDWQWEMRQAIGLLSDQAKLERILSPMDAFKSAQAPAAPSQEPAEAPVPDAKPAPVAKAAGSFQWPIDMGHNARETVTF